MSELLLRGRVWTNDAATPWAEAVLLRDDTVVAVGAFEAVRALARTRRVLDVGEGLVTPGLVDAHVHLASHGRALASVRCGGARSLAEVVSRAQAWASRHPDGWVLGRGWDQLEWGVDQLPNATLLDAAFPDRPAYLTRVDGHAALANRAALRAAGFLDSVKSPPGGSFGRLADGRLDGLLVDTAMSPVEAAIPVPTRRALESWISAAARELVSLGLTGAHDAMVDPDQDTAFVSLASARALPLHVYGMADLSQESGRVLVEQGLRPPLHRYTMRAVKLFADGALGSRGAQLFTPYCDADHAGLAVQDDATLGRVLRLAAHHGFQPCVHAIGDRANARVLDLVAKLAAEDVTLSSPRIEHAQVVRPADVERFVRLGVTASMQPIHAVSDRRHAAARLGPERLDGAYAWRAMSSADVRLAFGSDLPIESGDPLLGLRAAITGRDVDGEPPGGFLPGHWLSRDEALRAYTSGPAAASFDGARAGRLAPGARADVTVFSSDPFVRPGEVAKVPVAATIVEGEVVFEG